MNDRFHFAIRSIDDFNRQDARLWHTPFDRNEPYEFAYSEQLSRWVIRLCPDASEHVQLAARAMHIGRWMKPRKTFPTGLNGYLQWREDLKQHHAGTAADLLKPLGYANDDLARVQALIRKEDPDDPEVQLLEDALCLVFLEHQLPDFMTKHDDPKVIDILQKTWTKMSDQGREAALALEYSDKAAALVKKAVDNRGI